MAWEFMTEDQRKAAAEAGHGPKTTRLVEIPEDLYLGYSADAKLLGLSAGEAIVATLIANRAGV
jgi:hypothetical protein